MSIFLKGNMIYCANVGDSRAVLVRGGSPVPLNRDHKAELADEAQRILDHQGRIMAYKDEDGSDIGPLRVWIREADLPGLAMTRSLGDGIAQTVGVTCEPEIKQFELSPND